MEGKGKPHTAADHALKALPRDRHYPHLPFLNTFITLFKCQKHVENTFFIDKRERDVK